VAQEPQVAGRSTTTLASAALPTGASRAGFERPTLLRLVLTGPGGGAWDVQLGGQGEAHPEDGAAARVRIVADAVDFCRLVSATAARRPTSP